jgi:hypothetical protein
MACVVGLLLPLILRGAGGKAPAPAAHAWPVAAAAKPAPVLRDFVAAPSTGRLTDQAVLSLKQILAQPAPPRQSLVHVDLNRWVRLAIVSVPQWTREVSGRHLMCVPLLSLKW